MKRIRSWFRKYADDLLFIVGFVFILIGSYCLYPVSAWFVAGVECLIYGVLIAWSHKK
jgi:hypothetical protein